MGAPQINMLSNLLPERLQALSPQLRKAARFVVENQGDVATRSQRYVAEASDLPAPTFTRLARAIGFQNYDQLRDVCRDSILQSQTALADRALELSRADRTETERASLITCHAMAAARNAEALIKSIDPASLDRASAVLADARQVVLIGELSCRALADYACYIANMSLTGWKTLGRSGDGLSAELSVLGPEDACIAISVSPYARRAIESAGHVADRGVPIIAITDNALSPVAAIAELSFYAGTDSPQFFPSHVSVLVALETIVDKAIRTRGAEAQQHIASVERQNHKLGEYWQDNSAANKGDRTHEEHSEISD